MPNIFIKISDENSNSQTSGKQIFKIKYIGQAMRTAIFSGFVSAILLGKISPITTEK